MQTCFRRVLLGERTASQTMSTASAPGNTRQLRNYIILDNTLVRSIFYGGWDAEASAREFLANYSGSAFGCCIIRHLLGTDELASAVLETG